MGPVWKSWSWETLVNGTSRDVGGIALQTCLSPEFPDTAARVKLSWLLCVHAGGHHLRGIDLQPFLGACPMFPSLFWSFSSGSGCSFETIASGDFWEQRPGGTLASSSPGVENGRAVLQGGRGSRMLTLSTNSKNLYVCFCSSQFLCLPKYVQENEQAVVYSFLVPYLQFIFSKFLLPIFFTSFSTLIIYSSTHLLPWHLWCLIHLRCPSCVPLNHWPHIRESFVVTPYWWASVVAPHWVSSAGVQP